MPAIKNALLRYRIIDRAIRNEYSPYPSKRDLRQFCEEEIFGSSDGAHICDSTIEKDLFAMRIEHDAPINYSKKDRGYYYSDSSFSMDDVPLTEKDINAIKAASTILHQFKNTSLFGQYEFAIQKILDRAISSEKTNNDEEGQVIQFESLPTIRGNENLELFLNAIKNKKVVQFDYFNFTKNKKSVRRIHPYLLKEYRNRWYLIGKSELKEKIITFGLDRIFDPILLTQKFILDSNFSPDNFFKHSIGITVFNELPSEIIIETNPILSKYLLSQPLHHSQILKEVINNGNHIFSFHLLITYELKMLLLGFGKDCKIVAPESLKEQILNDLKALLFSYENE
jgi:predicted DNA-binding transcriptional regulator YafY